MAKIRHSFTVPKPRDEVQGLFREEIGPELHRKAGFSRYRDEPGLLIYSDGIRDPYGSFAADDSAREYASLRLSTSHRIRIEFDRALTGTTVTIEGHAERGIRDALQSLGEQGRWPDKPAR
jgi:hypothetical protein